VSDSAYWNWRYANGRGSGDGSTGEPVRKKVEWLSDLKRISSIVEIGCGDFAFGSQLLEKFPDALYAGYDISDLIVHRNAILYPGVAFGVIGPEKPIPPSDLLLCLDVLFHITDDREYEAMLSRLENAPWRYLALTAYEYDGNNTSSHVRIRKFDPTRFASSRAFPDPLLREVIEDEGQMYFYIFSRT
jgi:trans-aconitate methyltransferase